MKRDDHRPPAGETAAAVQMRCHRRRRAVKEPALQNIDHSPRTSAPAPNLNLNVELFQLLARWPETLPDFIRDPTSRSGVHNQNALVRTSVSVSLVSFLRTMR